MHCPKCQSEKQVKAGFQGQKQRYKCSECGRLFVERSKRGRSEAEKALALKLYLEGLGFRSIGRILGVSNVAVLYWIRDAAKKLPKPEKPANVTFLELDELCLFLKKRSERYGAGLLLSVSANRLLTLNSAAVVSEP